MNCKIIDTPSQEYRGKIIEFLCQNLGGEHPLNNTLLFDWFYLNRNNQNNSDSNSKKLNFFIALKDNNIISLLGFFNVNYRKGMEIQKGIFLAMWLTLPEHRKGIGALLMKYALDNNKIISALGASEMNKPICNALGFKIINNISSYIYILKERDYSSIIINTNNKLKKDEKKIKTHPRPFSFETFSKEVMDIPVKSINIKPFGRDLIVETHKEQEYLDWRYNKHPFFEYFWSGIKSEKEIVSWLVWRVVRLGEIKLCRIVDFDITEYRPELNEYVNALLSELKYYSHLIGCDYIDFYTTNSFLIPVSYRVIWSRTSQESSSDPETRRNQCQLLYI